MRRKAISPRNGAAHWAIFLVLFICVTFGVVQAALAEENNLVISEIMYNVAGTDSGHEWIEVYNLGIENVIASSTWRFFDSSNHNINLYQGTSTIASNDFFVLADNGEQFLLDYPDYVGSVFDTVMSLPNSSSSIALSFDGGSSYELEEYYDFLWGANGNGYSLEKINYVTSSPSNWQESAESGGTPGQINSDGQSEDLPTDDGLSEDNLQQNWSQLVINEFLPNPEGSDAGEWIELYNNGPESLNLDGLRIKDQSARVFTLNIDDGLNLQVASYSYFLLPKSISSISLNNSNGDGVTIMNPNGGIIQTIQYNDSALEGRSYARSDNGFVWTKTPTPGQANQISINQPPIAQISVDSDNFLIAEKVNFSASLSHDPEGDDLDYLWEFGDGKNSSKENIKHSFDNPGAYTINLTVSDPEGASDSIEFNLKIFQLERKTGDNNSELNKETIDQKIIINLAEDDLIISEFIPNPVGSDDNEWIELYNATDKDMDLYGWQIDDEDGGSKPYQFATSTIILAKDYLLLNREQTKITLNNSGDSVRLLNPVGDVWQGVIYEKIPEGKSYAWDFINNEWNINEASPGSANIFVEDSKLLTSSTEAQLQDDNIEIIYGVAEIKDLEKNQEVNIQGVVVNNIDKNTRSLYLADYNFSDYNFEELVEVYSYYKKWPAVKVGDLVTAHGKISKLGNLPRVKIKTEQDIWKNDININLLDPEIIGVEDIDEDLLGSYINVKGIVVKKSGKNIYLAPDIEEDYIVRVYSKFSTKELDIKKGDELLVAGLLSETDSGFKLVPFGIGDIAVSKQVLGEKIKAKNYEENKVSTSISQIIAEDRKNSVKKILIFIVIGLVLVAVVYFIKKKRG